MLWPITKLLVNICLIILALGFLFVVFMILMPLFMNRTFALTFF